MLEKYARVPPRKILKEIEATPHQRNQGQETGKRGESINRAQTRTTKRETKRTTVRPVLFGSPLQDRARVFPVKGARDALRDLETGIKMADG